MIFTSYPMVYFLPTKDQHELFNNQLKLNAGVRNGANKPHTSALTLTPSTLLVHPSPLRTEIVKTQKRVSPGLLWSITWLEGLEEDAHAV